jgi:hypothetical protein
MARPQRQRHNPKRGMILALAAVGLLALAPSRWTQWLGAFTDLSRLLAAPAQWPFGMVVSALRPPAPIVDPSDPVVAQLRAEIDAWKARSYQQQAEIEGKDRLIADLQRGLSVAADLPVKQLPASVIGPGANLSSTTLTIKAGTSGGVVAGSTIAVVKGVQLLGRVVDSSSRSCEVIPITDRSSPVLLAQIIVSEPDLALLCSLRPGGDGTLKGPVEFPAGTANPPEIKVGMTVRLRDDTWPRHAQGLVVGEVVSVKVNDNQRREVAVRPLVRLDRVSEVVLRILAEPGTPGGEASR